MIAFSSITLFFKIWSYYVEKQKYYTQQLNQNHTHSSCFFLYLVQNRICCAHISFWISGHLNLNRIKNSILLNDKVISFGVINRSIYDIFPPLTNLNYNFIKVESCQSVNYRDDCPRLNAARYSTAIIANALSHINIGIAVGTLDEIDPGL